MNFSVSDILSLPTPPLRDSSSLHGSESEQSRKLAPWSLRELLFTNSFLGRNWPSEGLLPDMSRTFRAPGGEGPPAPPLFCSKNRTPARFDKGGGRAPPRLPPSSRPPPPPEGPLRGQLLSLLLLCTLQHFALCTLPVRVRDYGPIRTWVTGGI